jgi:hypothetical protein
MRLLVWVFTADRAGSATVWACWSGRPSGPHRGGSTGSRRRGRSPIARRSARVGRSGVGRRLPSPRSSGRGHGRTGPRCDTVATWPPGERHDQANRLLDHIGRDVKNGQQLLLKCSDWSRRAPDVVAEVFELLHEHR